VTPEAKELFESAVRALNEKEYRAAVFYFRRLVKLDPSLVEAGYNLAASLHMAGDDKEALVAYRQCHQDHPGHLDTAFNLASLLIDRGEHAEAERILETLRLRRPDDADILENLAMAKWRGRAERAAAPDRGADHRRILVACMPKSGSTFLTDVLAKLPGMRRVHLVPTYGRREQELDLEQLVTHQGMSYVSQLHIKPSEATLDLCRQFGLRPLFLFRNIWDVMASLRDHMYSHVLDWSMARIDSDFRGWDEARQYDFLARTMMPWFVDFYVSWSLVPGRLAVRYEELMADPAATVAGAAEWAGIVASETEIAQALAATGHASTFNKGGSGRGKAVPAAARAHVEALASYYPQVDFTPLLAG
jgi:hypothetical protein